MSHTLLVVVAVVASALALAATAPAAPAPKTVQGAVGPGFTIELTLGHRHVSTLEQGVRYRLVINDRSSNHDFHLLGPGLNRVLTTVGFVGTKSFGVTLRKGVYRYLCDPHASFMRGSFRVV